MLDSSFNVEPWGMIMITIAVAGQILNYDFSNGYSEKAAEHSHDTLAREKELKI